MKTFIITYLMNLMTDLHPGHFRRRRRRRRKRKRRKKRRKEDKERRRKRRRRKPSTSAATWTTPRAGPCEGLSVCWAGVRRRVLLWPQNPGSQRERIRL